jgi:glycosyl transferase family WbsX
MTDSAASRREDDTIVAAYTCPLWHPSALFDKQYGVGWSEYELMRGARPRTPGHRQPRQPLLGALDEARPETWEIYNSLAAQHGVDVLIWDWYWYEGGPALHEALECGFLRATGTRLRFSVMWVNHHWMTLYPTTLRDRAGLERAFLAPDSEADVWRGWSTIASRYFHLEDYWCIDGDPVFVIWDLERIVEKLGRDRVRRLIGQLRSHAVSLGHSGVHLHANLTMALWRAGGDAAVATAGLDELGVDSCGLYNPLLSVDAPATGTPRYAELAQLATTVLQPALRGASPIPYLPAASPGWDTTPRMPYPGQGEDVHRHSEQGLLLVEGGTPAEFEDLVRASLELARGNAPGRRVVTIGCFNEWTEGQYLLPDTDYGYGMLRALSRARGYVDDRVYYPTTAGDSNLAS